MPQAIFQVVYGYITTPKRILLYMGKVLRTSKRSNLIFTNEKNKKVVFTNTYKTTTQTDTLNHKKRHIYYMCPKIHEYLSIHYPSKNASNYYSKTKNIKNLEKT
ncbi:protein of unknown function [Tenacibaculum sp. 190130A14a]|uniref:Uncharacterized protein n=1 Tax=Tenacibaculum polynesiense TaxID=3137857 RepID=A0ABP1F3K8_9FLAO